MKIVPDKIRHFFKTLRQPELVTLADYDAASVQLCTRALQALVDGKDHWYIIAESDDNIIEVAKDAEGLRLQIATYPYAVEPDLKLAELGISTVGARLESWESNMFAVYRFPDH